MVKPTKATRLLYRKQVSDLFDNTQDGLIAAWIFANITFFILREVEARFARPEVFFDSPNALSKFNCFLVRHFEDMVGESLSTLFSNAWKIGKSIN